MGEENKKNISYTTPKFHRRCFANVIDFLLFLVVAVSFFLAARWIVSLTPSFKNNEARLLQIREESGLYYVDGDKSEDMLYHIDTGNNTAYMKCVKTDEAIEKFIVYLKNNVSEEASKKVRDDYDSFRLDPKFVYEKEGTKIPYFIKKESGSIERNPELNDLVSKREYFEKVYTPFFDEHALGYLVTAVPEYLGLVRYESIMLFAVEIPVGWLIGGLLVYLLPGLLFRRGRRTIGKWMYQIGLANAKLLSCSAGRFVARWAIFFFGVLTLSIFTFGIPMIVSFSLMAFSKRKQGFPDYILGLIEVDVSYQKLYFSFDEIIVTGAGEPHKAIDFKPVDRL